MAGSVRGRAGSNLSTFVGNAGSAGKAAGARAEAATAAILNEVAAAGCMVDHSVVVAHGRADADHVVNGSRGTVVIDDKSWLPGWYLTTPGGRTFRLAGGRIKRFTPAESGSLEMTARSMRDAGLRVRGVYVCVHPSRRGGKVHLGLARYRGATFVSPDRLARRVTSAAGAGNIDRDNAAAYGRWVSANARRR